MTKDEDELREIKNIIRNHFQIWVFSYNNGEEEELDKLAQAILSWHRKGD